MSTNKIDDVEKLIKREMKNNGVKIEIPNPYKDYSAQIYDFIAYLVNQEKAYTKLAMADHMFRWIDGQKIVTYPINEKSYLEFTGKGKIKGHVDFHVGKHIFENVPLEIVMEKEDAGGKRKINAQLNMGLVEIDEEVYYKTEIWSFIQGEYDLDLNKVRDIYEE